MATKTYHMSLNVEGAIRNKFFSGWSDDGRKMSRNAACAYLVQCRNEGKRLVPLDDKACQEFDYQKGCPGHEYIKSDPPRYDPGEHDFPRTVE